MSTKYSQKKLYAKYFKKTGIQITDEPLEFIPKELAKKTEKYHPNRNMSPYQAIKELPTLIEQYPDIPTFKNYLCNYYQRLGNSKAANQLSERIMQEHPDYIFGFANKMLNAEKAQLIKLGHHLGENRSIKDVIKTNRAIHFTEFVTYQMTAAFYELAINEENAAMIRLQSLIDVNADALAINQLAEKIVFHQVENMAEQMEELEQTGIDAPARRSVHYPPATQPPSFYHGEVNIFYKRTPDNLSKEEQQQIINLPRHTLIADLEKVLEDSIRRWKHYQTKRFDKKTYSFPFHAIYFLGALEAKESLSKVLDLLRMEEEFIEYWFSDWREDVFYPTLYQLGKNQLSVLMDYCKETYHDGYDRSLVLTPVAQIALHEPERRAEVLEWFTSLLEYLLANPEKEGLIDTMFVASIVGELIDIRGVELLSLIEKMYKKGWVDEIIHGDWSDVKKDINRSVDPYDLKPLPDNINEYYDKSYEKRRAPFDKEAYKEYFTEDNDLENPEAEELVASLYTKMLMGVMDGIEEPLDSIEEYNEEYERTVQDTIVRTTKKVGRNDPCPCGSGKKYKKCCLKK